MTRTRRPGPAAPADDAGAFALDGDPFPLDGPDGLCFPTPALSQRIDLVHHLVQFSDLTLVVVAPRGAGKTTFLHELLRTAGERWRICEVTGTPEIDPERLIAALLAGYDLPARDPPEEALAVLESHLESLHRSQQVALVAIDDAHLLPEATRRRLMDLVLRWEGFRARVLLLEEPSAPPAEASDGRRLDDLLHRVELPALGEEQTGDYIHVRLTRAGLVGDSPFTPEVVRGVYRASDGIPGKVHALAAQVLANARAAAPRTRRRPSLAIALVAVAGVGALAVGLAYLRARSSSPAAVEVPAPLPPAHAPAASGATAAPAARHAQAAPSTSAPASAAAPAPTAPEPAPESPNPASADRAAGAAPGSGAPPAESAAQSVRPIDEGPPLVAVPVPPASEPPAAGSASPAPPPAPPVAALPFAAAASAETGSSAGTAESAPAAEAGAPPSATSTHPAAGAKSAGPSHRAQTLTADDLPAASAGGHAAAARSPAPTPTPSSAPARAAAPRPTPSPPPKRVATVREPRLPHTHGLAWLRTRPRGSYTIQLMGSYHPASIERFVAAHRLRGDTAWAHTRLKGRDWFVVLYGAYPTRDAARSAIASLPASVRRGSPWPRSVAGVVASSVSP